MLTDLSDLRLPPRVRAVVFDWAGTTIDFGCMAPAEAFLGVFAAEGVPLTHAEARGPMGRHKREHLRILLADPAIQARFVARFGRAPEPHDLDRMFARFVPTQLACLAAHAELVPGTLETMAALRRLGVRVGSTSGYTSDMMAIVCREAALRGYAPEVTVCASDVAVARPGPAMALAALAALGVEPRFAVKVGDTVADIGEGLSAGMWTIGVTVSGNEVGLPLADWSALPSARRAELRQIAAERLVAAGAHLVIDSVAELMPALARVEAAMATGVGPVAGVAVAELGRAA